MPEVLSTVYGIEVLVFLIECQVTCIKNSYIFSKSVRDWNNSRRVCNEQGFDLVSIETEEEWYLEYWCMAHWFMEDSRGLVLAEWKAEISKNGGLFNGISWHDKMLTFATLGRFKPERRKSRGKYSFLL